MESKGQITRDIELKKAKSGDKLACGGGLVFDVSEAGTKVFRFRYRYGNKPFLYTIGRYGSAEGEFTLQEARFERDRLKRLIKSGVNPSLEKKKEKMKLLDKVGDNVESIVRDWFKTQDGKRSADTNEKNLKRFEKHIFPRIGYMPIQDIETSHLYAVFEHISDKPNTCKKIKEDLRRAFKKAIFLKKIKHNPVSEIELKEIVQKKAENNMAFLEEKELPKFFKAVYKNNSLTNQLGLLPFHFSMLTALRPSNVREMKWEYIDLANNEIAIPPENMKVSKPHIVPISKQLRKVIESASELKQQSDYVFPSSGKSGHISEHASMNIIRNAGYKGKMTMHGWRHCFSTIANESQEFSSDAIEVHLHHSTKSSNKIRATYNKAEYMDERIRLVQWWGDKLESLGAKFNFDIDSGEVS